MRTIIDNAESILQKKKEITNRVIRLQSAGTEDENIGLFSLQSFAVHESWSNPDFFKWLFDDPEIKIFGTNLSRSQLKEYLSWLQNL